MREYLLGIIAAALLVSLLHALGGQGAGEGMRRLVGGILLTLAVFRPMGDMELILPDLQEYRAAADAIAAEGISQAAAARRECISSELRAYILTRADDLGLQAEVEVILGEEEFPERILITAAAAPGARQELTERIVRELGVERETVTWIDPYQSKESTPYSEHTNTPS